MKKTEERKEDMTQGQVVLEIKKGRVVHEIIAKSKAELRDKLYGLLKEGNNYAWQAIAHLAYEEKGSVQCWGWSIKRIGTLKFVADGHEETPRKPQGEKERNVEQPVMIASSPVITPKIQEIDEDSFNLFSPE